MNSNAYIVLTEQGLSAMALSPWPAIAIKYFLPIYDESIDRLIHSEAGITSANILSAAITSAATQATLTGERIYNVPATSGVYTLTSNYIATSASSSTYSPPITILNSTVNDTASRTLFNGLALSPIISGDVEPVYNIATGDLQYVGGNASTVAQYTWPINSSLISRNNLFDSVAFNPSQVNDGVYDVVNGVFKFDLRSKVGSYRFNKIAFFIQPLNADGSVNASYDPILFGQVAFDKSSTVEEGGTGSQTFDVAIQLAFTIKAGTSVVTNNDYWSMVPLSASNRNQNGLFFAGDIALGTSAIPNSWQPRAKVHITDNSTTPHIRMSYSDGTSGLDVKVVDTSTSGMVSFVPTSKYAQGFGFAFGKGAIAEARSIGSAASTFVSLAFGTDSLSTRAEAIAIGYKTSATGIWCVSLGPLNLATVALNNFGTSFSFGSGCSAIAYSNLIAMSLGNNNIARGGIILGQNCSTSATLGKTAAIGDDLFVGDFLVKGINSSYAFGRASSALHQDAYSIGTFNFVDSPLSFALGMNIVLSGSGQYNGAIGFNNNINNNGQSKNWVFGADNLVSSARNSVAIGNGNDLRFNGTALVFGNLNDATMGGTLIGNSNNGSGSVFGDWSYAYSGSFAAGTSARAGSLKSIAIGFGAIASSTLFNRTGFPGEFNISNIAIGTDAVVRGPASYSIAMGDGADVNSLSGDGISIGRVSQSTFRSIALGSWTYAYGIESVSIGYNARTFNTLNPFPAGVDATNTRGLIAIGSNARAYNTSFGIAIGCDTDSFSLNGGEATTVGAFSRTSAQAIAGEIYPMTTIGQNLTNDYAGFMAGVRPATLTTMINLYGAVSTWNFVPLVVFGTGGITTDRRNGMMIGRLKHNEGITQKSCVILDFDNTPDYDWGATSATPGGVRFNAPAGTIFKIASDNYGFSYLGLYNPADDTSR